MWNMERNISGFEPESVLIIISHRLKHIEKKEWVACRLYTLIEVAISLHILTLLLWRWWHWLRWSGLSLGFQRMIYA
jgi:hypothetical protein